MVKYKPQPKPEYAFRGQPPSPRIPQPTYTTVTTTVQGKSTLIPFNQLDQEQQQQITAWNLKGLYEFAYQKNAPNLFLKIYDARYQSELKKYNEYKQQQYLEHKFGPPEKPSPLGWTGTITGVEPSEVHPTVYAPVERRNLTQEEFNKVVKDIPTDQIKYQPGAKEYFASLSNDERLRLIGINNINSAIRNYQNPLSPDITLNNRIYKMAEQLEKKYGKRSDTLTQAVTNVLWQDITEVEPKETYYASLSPVERSTTSFFQSARQMAVGTITFPISVFEFAGGAVLGHPTGIPIISDYKKKYESWEQRQTLGPSGGLSRAFVEGSQRLGFATEEERAYVQKQQEKYPVESIFATLGEIGGAFAGGAVYGLGKTAFSKGFQWTTKKVFGKPYLPSAFGPISIIRKVKYTLEKKPFKPPETVFRPETLLEGPKASKYGQVLYKQGIQEFKQSKGMIEPGQFTLVSASPQPIGRLGFLGRTTKKIVAGKGTSETPGIATSPYTKAIPAFLGLEPDWTTSYRPSLLPKGRFPTLTPFLAKQIVHLPKAVRPSFKKATKFMKEQPKGEYGVVSVKMEMGRGGLPEPEVTIWQKTPSLGPGEISAFTKYKGVTVAETTPYKLTNLPIKPAWELSKIPGLTHPTASYLNYLASSTDIIRVFKNTAKKYAKEIYDAAAKHEKLMTGKITESTKNYHAALKYIEKLVREKEFALQEYVKPTVAGQLKLKGFTSIGEKAKGLYIEKPGETSIPISTSILKIKPYYSTSTKKSYPSYEKPYKSIPSYPSKPSYPSYPSEPSEPSEPPSEPSYPSYPSYYPYPSEGNIVPILPLGEPKSYPTKPSRSYNVFVRKNSTWKSLDTNLSLTEALSLGSKSVDNTLSTKFKLISSNKPSKSKGYSGWESIKHKFTPSNSNTYIEKSKYRLDTEGENKEYYSIHKPRLTPKATPYTQKLPTQHTKPQSTIKISYKPFKMKALKL